MAVAVDLPLHSSAKLVEDDENVREPAAVERSSVSRSGVGNRLRVTFSDLEYIVQNQANKSEKLALLKGVSGFCNPGTLAVVVVAD